MGSVEAHDEADANEDGAEEGAEHVEVLADRDVLHEARALRLVLQVHLALLDVRGL